MEHSSVGTTQSTTTSTTTSCSSSVIVQNSQSDDGLVLTSLSDIQQQHQQHLQHHQQSSHRTPSSIQQASSSSAASSPVLSPPGKTFGRNYNGTSKLLIHIPNDAVIPKKKRRTWSRWLSFDLARDSCFWFQMSWGQMRWSITKGFNGFLVSSHNFLLLLFCWFESVCFRKWK